MNLDGTDREIIFQDAQYNPISIAFHKGTIYWVDNKNGTVKTFSIHHMNGAFRNNSHSQLFSYERGRTSNLKIFDISSQPSSLSNACSKSKCPGLCFNTPNTSICRCPDNFILSDSGSQCISSTKSFELENKNCTTGFQCVKSRQCVDVKDLCDGFDDCDDGSDESNIGDGPCNPKKCDLNLHFVCNERCYQRSLLCSPIGYCLDGTDHQNCETHSCNSNEFTCAKSGKCIQLAWVNDGMADCGPDDSSDEEGEDFLEEKCAEFECHNGVCRPFSAVCDGVDQCG